MNHSSCKPLALAISLLAVSPFLVVTAAVSTGPAYAEVTISSADGGTNTWDEVTDDGASISDSEDEDGGEVETLVSDTCEEVSDVSVRVSRC